MRIDLEAEADREACGALKDYWYVACLTSELKAGVPLARTVFGVPLVLFRDPAGQPVALFDRCLHRNARLSAGVVMNGCLSCPYHGWTYNGAGQCVEIPSLGPDQRGHCLDEAGHRSAGLDLAPADVGRVPAWATCEQEGLVYVYPGADPSAARRPPMGLPHFGEAGWRSYFMVTDFPNGVTHLVENFMDVPHTVFVHRGWFRRASRRQVPARVERRGERVCITYAQARDRISGLGRVFNPTGESMTHTDLFIAPNVTRVDYGWGPEGAAHPRSGFTIMSQCTPVGPTASRVYTAIGFRLPRDLPGAAVARLFQPVLAWYTRQVIQQDVAIMAVQREGLCNAPGGGVFRSTEADLPHTDIEAVRAWLRDGAKGPGPSTEDRHMEFWI